MNYRAYFKSLDCDSYRIELITDSGNSWTELQLAQEAPFTVNYSVSDSPFDPVRTSIATLNFLSDNYFEDIVSPYAHGTQVNLYKTNGTETLEWTGFLAPEIYSNSYVRCTENIELTANDCLNTLEYIDFESKTDNRGFVTIKDILDQVLYKCGDGLTAYYWTRSKKVGTSILLPSQVKISEQNFFFDDTDEPWKLNEVLEEICRYFGFTCLQWGNALYFIDYQYLHNNSDFFFTKYIKSGESTSVSSNYHIGGTYTITQDDYKGSDNTITFEPIYNKCKVNANFYEAEYFIPNIFDDRFLTNRLGTHELYENQEIAPDTPDIPIYPKGTKLFQQKYVHDGSGDSQYSYFERLFDHQYYESIYLDPLNNVLSLTDEQKANSAITCDYKGATLLDLGTVKKEYLSEYGQWIVPSSMDYERYLCCSLRFRFNNGEFNNYAPIYKLKDGYHSNVMMSPNSFLVLDFSLLWERYEGRGYINPDWSSDNCEISQYVGHLAEEEGGYPRFKLRIGNKWWNGSDWVIRDSAFAVQTEMTSAEKQKWNSELKVLNNVSWSEMVNVAGYKIPLADVDTTEVIEFSVVGPKPNFWFYLNENESVNMLYNAYIWLKDLSLKCVELGQGAERLENDVIYENIIDVDAVNEISDITVKLTTYTPMVSPAYSNVIYYNGSANTLLTAVKEENLSGNAQKPEENIVEKYVNQYSTKTKKFELELGLGLTPFTKAYSVYVDDPYEAYCILGQNIDYKRGKQNITFIEKK